MNKVVIYTPAEDFWYNSDLGPTFLLWFFCFICAVLIVAGTFGDSKRGSLKHWQFIGIVACCTLTLHWIATWALVHI